MKLADNKEAQEYRENYPSGSPARKAPKVIKGDNIARNTYWHGRISSEWAEWWVRKWTDGKGTYCVANMEDSGTLAALKRLSEAGKVSFDRIMILRTASNFDQQSPGQSALESISSNSHGYILSIENAYKVGQVVVHYIISNWEKWEHGVPELDSEKGKALLFEGGAKKQTQSNPISNGDCYIFL
jgi:purine nucleoside permease